MNEKIKKKYMGLSHVENKEVAYIEITALPSQKDGLENYKTVFALVKTDDEYNYVILHDVIYTRGEKIFIIAKAVIYNILGEEGEFKNPAGSTTLDYIDGTKKVIGLFRENFPFEKRISNYQFNEDLLLDFIPFLNDDNNSMSSIMQSKIDYSLDDFDWAKDVLQSAIKGRGFYEGDAFEEYITFDQIGNSNINTVYQDYAEAAKF